MMDALIKEDIFGKVEAFVGVVEWQKRGLPHAHILIIMDARYKPETPADIDLFINAELPDINTEPILHNLVKQLMLHTPCGPFNPSAPCMPGNNKPCNKK